MTAFAWQTLLLLGLTYVLGCWIACLARRMIAPSTAPSRSSAMVPAGAIAGAAAAGAAARQSMAPSYTPKPIAPVAPPAPVRDAFRRADTLEPMPGSEVTGRPTTVSSRHQSSSSSSVDPVSRFERALAGPHEARPATTPQQPSKGAVAGGTGAAAAVSIPRSPEISRLPAGRSADDLKRIRAIDQTLETALHRLGVRTFAEIGAWKPADVARISHELGFQVRIEQENWIEQAQILASGKDTYYSSLLAKGVLPETTKPKPATAPVSQIPAVVPTPPLASGSVVAAAAIAPASSAASSATRPVAAVRTERVSFETAAAAAAAMAAAAAAASRPPIADEPIVNPVPTASQERSPDIAAPAPAVPITPSVTSPAESSSPEQARPAVASRDVLQRIGGITPEIERLLFAQGVARYGQIAQWTGIDVERFDQLLGHQGRIRRENWVEQAQILARGGDTASSRDFERRDADAVAPKPVPPVTRVQALSQPMPSTPALAEAAAKPDVPAVGALPITQPAATPSMPEAAASASVVAATAAASAAVAALATVRPTTANGTPPAASAAATPRIESVSSSDAQRSGDLSSLRSVRSEALRATGSSPFAARAGEAHDLKRIRGIGVLIEKKLNQMGVMTYEQIAEWTVADIERVSHVLDFKGRIERENWVEQARILASGGQTEFSRRADRGETGGM